MEVLHVLEGSGLRLELEVELTVELALDVLLWLLGPVGSQQVSNDALLGGYATGGCGT